VSGQPHAPAALPSVPIGYEAESRHSLDAVAKRKISLHFPSRESNPGCPACSLVTVLRKRPPDLAGPVKYLKS